jgi:predicted ester cyclase
MSAEESKALVAIRATHLGAWRGLAPTGRSFTWMSMNIHRVAGGRIAEQWSQYDVLSLLEQLGARPQP